MTRTLLILSAILLSTPLLAQTWLDQARKEQSMTRIAFGAQAMEPTGVLVQLYKGGFCSNDNTYANYITLEAFAGLENILMENHKSYRSGKWSAAGFQTGVNLLYPLYTLPAPSFSAQVHVGAGLQGGSRNYTELGLTSTNTTYGGNLFLRFSLTGKGITISKRLWFISYFADAKYYSQFGEKFSYFRPSVGLLFRKVR